MRMQMAEGTSAVRMAKLKEGSEAKAVWGRRRRRKRRRVRGGGRMASTLWAAWTDFMHTGPGGVIKDLVKCMQGMQRNSNVDEYEADINKRTVKSEPHIAS